MTAEEKRHLPLRGGPDWRWKYDDARRKRKNSRPTKDGVFNGANMSFQASLNFGAAGRWCLAVKLHGVLFVSQEASAIRVAFALGPSTV